MEVVQARMTMELRLGSHALYTATYMMWLGSYLVLEVETSSIAIDMPLQTSGSRQTRSQLAADWSLEGLPRFPGAAS